MIFLAAIPDRVLNILFKFKFLFLQKLDLLGYYKRFISGVSFNDIILTIHFASLLAWIFE